MVEEDRVYGPVNLEGVREDDEGSSFWNVPAIAEGVYSSGNGFTGNFVKGDYEGADSTGEGKSPADRGIGTKGIDRRARSKKGGLVGCCATSCKDNDDCILDGVGQLDSSPHGSLPTGRQVRRRGIPEAAGAFDPPGDPVENLETSLAYTTVRLKNADDRKLGPLLLCGMDDLFSRV